MHKLIPGVHRQNAEMTCYLIQILQDTDALDSIYRFKTANDASYIICGAQEVFYCERWKPHKDVLEEKIGTELSHEHNLHYDRKQQKVNFGTEVCHKNYKI